MSKPEDISQGVWDEAERLVEAIYPSFLDNSTDVRTVARAILSAEKRGEEREREACADAAKTAHGIDRRPEDDLQIGAIAGCIAAAAAIRARRNNVNTTHKTNQGN